MADGDLVNQIAKDAWADTIRAAEAFNDPGSFTTFVAYEFTSSTDDRVIFTETSFSRQLIVCRRCLFPVFTAKTPKGYRDWMDGLRNNGIEALAIPHNSNGSNGQMFKMVDWASNPVDDEWARKRIRNEPLVEVTQVKGTSETHPFFHD